MYGGRRVSGAELKKHCAEADCWVSIHGFVYDVTSFIHLHPGSSQVLIARAGTDISPDFDIIGHSSRAHDILEDLKVGEIGYFDEGYEGEEDDRLIQSTRNMNVDNNQHREHLSADEDNQNQEDLINMISVEWHKIRRNRILQDHPEVSSLMEGNPRTPILGVCFSIIHLLVALVVQDYSLITTLILAYTIGSICKFYQFMVGHELVHRLCGPFFARPFVKGIFMMLVNLPSFGNFLFNYVDLLHLGHHASLGRHADFLSYDEEEMTQAGNFYKRIPYASLQIDGDLLTPNFLREVVLDPFFPDNLAWFRAIKFSLSPVLFVAPQWILEALIFLLNFIFFIPALVFYLVFPTESADSFHPIFSLLPSFLSFLIPTNHQDNADNDSSDGNDEGQVSTLSYLFLLLLLTGFVGEVWWLFMSATRTRAGALQTIVWFAALLIMMQVRPDDIGSIFDSDSKGIWGEHASNTLIYLVGTELFFQGFCLNPYGGYFITVHNSTPSQSAHDPVTRPLQDLIDNRPTSSSSFISSSANADTMDTIELHQLNGATATDEDFDNDDDSKHPGSELVDEKTQVATDYTTTELHARQVTQKARAMTCQPTQSIYGTLSGWMTGNLTYHVEHHDFPTIPWNKLPQLRKIAPEYYNYLNSSPSLFHSVWRSIWHGEGTSYACFD